MEIKRGLPVGGQALPNGVMMRSHEKTAVALRLRSGRIVTDSWPSRQKHTVKKPFLRGIHQLAVSFKASFQTLLRSVRLSKNSGELHISPLSVVCAASAVILLGLYAFVSDWFYGYLGLLLSEFSQHYLFTFLYGVCDLILFCFTLFIITRLPAVSKLLKYHGAEHKAITCYEAGLDMTIENVRAQSRFHRRCGTSMVALMALACVAALVFIPPQLSEVVQELILFIIILAAVGISYEAMRSKKNTLIVRLGLAAQRLTTREPDDAMIECAIGALTESVKI